MKEKLLVSSIGMSLLLLSSCAATKSAAEMRRIQEQEGAFAGSEWHESIFYAGSTQKYHYLWQKYLPWWDYGAPWETQWRAFRVPRSELVLEPGLEHAYDSAAKHEDTTMRYAEITASPFKLVKRATSNERAKRFRDEIRTGKREVRTKVETLDDGTQQTLIWTEKKKLVPSSPEPPPLPISPLP